MVNFSHDSMTRYDKCDDVGFPIVNFPYKQAHFAQS